MNLISILFNQFLSNYWKRENWMHHLRNSFPNQTITEIAAQFEHDNKHFIREYQNLINELRVLYCNMQYEMRSDDWVWQ